VTVDAIAVPAKKKPLPYIEIAVVTASIPAIEKFETMAVEFGL